MNFDMGFLFNSVTAWLGIAGMGVITLIVLSYVFPKLRVTLLGAAAVLGTAALIYAKGGRDRANADAARRNKAAEKVKREYEKIDSRADTPSTAVKRMRDGGY